MTMLKTPMFLIACALLLQTARANNFCTPINEILPERDDYLIVSGAHIWDGGSFVLKVSCSDFTRSIRFTNSNVKNINAGKIVVYSNEKTSIKNETLIDAKNEDYFFKSSAKMKIKTEALKSSFTTLENCTENDIEFPPLYKFMAALLKYDANKHKDFEFLIKNKSGRKELLKRLELHAKKFNHEITVK